LNNDYDVAVIGGGVNGTGIARDCALRGYKTILIEKNDFSAGATGTCSGMIHGGVRYLSGDVGTTRKACLDSGFIQKIAPHMLFRIPFIAPILDEGWFAKLMIELMEAYFTAYDEFSPLKRGKPHTRLTKEEALQLEPGLPENIIGALSIDEWGIDPFRLCAENAVSAGEAGAEICNHTEVTGFIVENHAVKGVKVRGRRAGEIRAKIVMNAGGPWLMKVARLAGVDVKIRPGKGVHLILDRRVSNMAVLATAVDGRQIFVMPHESTSLIGTTDDDYYGDLDNIVATEDEVEYLLQGMERYVPCIRKHRIIRVMAGVRPTLYGWGKNEDALSREHEVYDHETRDGVAGLLTMAGGKLASYRLMSEDATNIIGTKLGRTAPCRTHTEPLPGGEAAADIEGLARKYRIPNIVVKRIAYRHGNRAERVLALIDKDRRNANVLCLCEPVTEAEVRYAIRNEFAVSVLDIKRRTRLGCGPCQGMRCALRAGEILGEELKLNSDEIFASMKEFIQERWKGKRPILNGIQAGQEELTQALYRNVLGLERY
jgi:glycerol-3-phosphate dehydrogenase